MKMPFLVVYDYGIWMDGAKRSRLAADMTFDIDERTVGLLAEIIDQRPS